ncbi:MAG TPA: DUF2270 domain-containing protein [Anaerolineales bacterium]|nr:DUF2270 domain-containing protein [Anaerolineales bacterium]
MSDEDLTSKKPPAGPTRVTTPSEDEPVWTYRGYQLGPGEFTTAMVHLFRAEINRANVWRMRLDTTTNWAVVITAAIITFAFSEPGGEHSAIILSMMLITLFLFIEARRYRYYELWSSRVRLMETDFYAAMLVPPFHPSSDWAESLAENLLQPHFSVSYLEAVGRRLRRNYLWIYLFLGIAWFIKLSLHPTATLSWPILVQRAGIGTTPGEFILIGMVVFFALVVTVAFATLGLQEASGEVLPRYFSAQDQAQEVEVETRSASKFRAWFKPHGRRKQLLALIITDKAQEVADRILSDMKRGVTSMAGKGMYTGVEHSILICALTVTEVGQLKELTRQADPKAFLIVTPAHDVLGKGFSPLETGE